MYKQTDLIIPEIHGISGCCIGDLAVPIGPIFCHPVVSLADLGAGK
jgi:hypothetical protein